MKNEKLNTKDVILNTATWLFAKHGYHGTGLNQIIKESGAPKGSLYYYFPKGKEELAIACVKLTQSNLQSKLQELMSRFAKPQDFLRAFILNIADRMDGFGTDKFVPFGFWAAAETSSVSDSLRDACQAALAEWKDTLSNKLVDTGITKERAVEMAEISVCLIEGATIMSVVERNSRAMRRAAKHISAILEE
ncbi:TetR/AcrR family transcriptional regulator [Paenibacillus macerans]|uniref:Bacterial regulatory s, tetR family protein n=1 Tax=Paenibacillus macerans TaxID=44252 RepID=A0A091A580_PAEMA|nr:TetR/AcrR family transcriptional regulator [Paenibacillus macerans]KFN11436.1 bacterial regulatory s, tetR family protein [Paenibacillus macerans]MCY7562031.1 TetR/AcrR family transcriptional regulator [Paenibacillus macerans]MEC0153896.1 TetR/AcrR family transcriptional regulator [Paenibacillus macerans]MED4953863.1 TetR/AcrR family transcriptional regulator [Paenibacillus macerans]SUA83320.1 transcriptional regulator yxaF [Paenibacillus macerans]